jgi:signal transduction histidine kinase
MQVSVPPPVTNALELDAALLQAVITAGLAALCAVLARRYRKPWFGWWTLAWSLYVARVGAIIAFLLTAERGLLFAHQVLTGWTALALLWSALVFSRGVRFRPAFLAAVLFPPVWSWIAIYRLDRFLLAALPMVLFLSFATFWSGLAFLQHRRRVGATGAAILAAALMLWALHHLDYPFLRAQGAWAPWGYYLDIVFELAVGAGILLLVLDDLGRGLDALSALSGDLQRGASGGDVAGLILARPLTLPGVRGTALYLRGAGFAAGAGSCSGWAGTEPDGIHAEAIAGALAARRPRSAGDGASHTFAAALPIFRGEEATGALLLVGDARDPFTALDDRFLLALGQQVGAALENADLYRRLEGRRRELERLSSRMVEQHESERRRLSRELHDETAQVFSAVKMELVTLRDGLAPDAASRLDHALVMVDTGIRSIRNVVNDLRPSLLDDLGLLPALRSLVAEIGARSGIAAALEAPPALPALPDDAELALYRAVQEALTNVVRHAGATAVRVRLAETAGALVLTVRDDGVGAPQGGGLEHPDRLGLRGMRERITALGGEVAVAGRPGEGVTVRVSLPLGASARPAGR